MVVTACGTYLILCGAGRSDVEPSGSSARVLFIMLLRSITNIMICLHNWNHFKCLPRKWMLFGRTRNDKLESSDDFSFFFLHFWLIVLYLSKNFLHFGTLITIRSPGRVVTSPQLLTRRQVY